MSLFTKEDREFSQRAKESDWSPTPPVVEQLREDFHNGNPSTEEIENHSDWEITNRRPTTISREDAPSVEAEIFKIKYRGDKDFETEIVPNEFVPREYQ